MTAADRVYVASPRLAQRIAVDQESKPAEARWPVYAVEEYDENCVTAIPGYLFEIEALERGWTYWRET